MAKPTKKQLQWAELELGVIIHYLMDIYDTTANAKTTEVREKLPASVFAPQGWDTDQWMRSAAAMGAKYAILVANHCSGFSLWPTKVNDYSVVSCTYKDGQGDIVKEFIESCKKYGIKPGLYYSTGCNGYCGICDEGMPPDYCQTEEYRRYVKEVVEPQVTELWSQYGELFEIWFDGGVIPPENGGPDLVPILKRYQPDAICFQGPREHPHNVRWVGNENGLAPTDCWGGTNAGEARYDGTIPDEQAGVGDPDGKYFWPAETDMANRDNRYAWGGGWGWVPNQSQYAFSTDHLIDCYLRSVGRNSNLLMGMAIGQNGLFEDEQQFINFGKRLEETFGEKAKIASAVGTASLTQELTLETPTDVRYIVLRENMEEGHRIRAFRISCDGKTITEGQCVGHKRILPVDVCGGKSFRFEITEACGTPSLRDITLY